MKNVFVGFIGIAAFLLLQSFVAPSNIIERSLDVKSSKIVWKAYKVTGSHEGTVNLQSGSLTFNEEQLVGGSFIMDMSSIACTDLQGDYKGQLEGHLKSDDFFGVASHPTSALEITGVRSVGKNAYQATADLTIKGITKKIDFQVSVYGQKATANLKVDRAQFDVKYGSNTFFDNLKDNAIYDEFDLIVDLQF